MTLIIVQWKSQMVGEVVCFINVAIGQRLDRTNCIVRYMRGLSHDHPRRHSCALSGFSRLNKRGCVVRCDPVGGGGMAGE